MVRFFEAPYSGLDVFVCLTGSAPYGRGTWGFFQLLIGVQTEIGAEFGTKIDSEMVTTIICFDHRNSTEIGPEIMSKIGTGNR